ncbi:hypothetical protein K402DRAFT_456974 [Aulographum hederae CBS 113979]|uniref:Uncharacterized protein n=1 Tax=Aulographum hederae CBS 113979 TaxID=1176131 RepID=A0A6G1GPT2_9PEZI|nr:hypothetical protein K402DRAFT_456974 [Aulographum hederae CBS 113979]
MENQSASAINQGEEAAFIGPATAPDLTVPSTRASSQATSSARGERPPNKNRKSNSAWASRAGKCLKCDSTDHTFKFCFNECKYCHKVHLGACEEGYKKFRKYGWAKSWMEVRVEEDLKRTMNERGMAYDPALEKTGRKYRNRPTQEVNRRYTPYPRYPRPQAGFVPRPHHAPGDWVNGQYIPYQQAFDQTAAPPVPNPNGYYNGAANAGGVPWNTQNSYFPGYSADQYGHVQGAAVYNVNPSMNGTFNPYPAGFGNGYAGSANIPAASRPRDPFSGPAVRTRPGKYRNQGGRNYNGRPWERNNSRA